MSPDGDTTLNESPLFRAYGSFTAAACIHALTYRPAHLYGLARQMLGLSQ